MMLMLQSSWTRVMACFLKNEMNLNIYSSAMSLKTRSSSVSLKRISCVLSSAGTLSPVTDGLGRGINFFLTFQSRSLKWYLLFSLDPAEQDIAVPEELAMILRVALSKMVAAKCLNPELINLDFWRKIPNKFKEIRFYEDRKNKIREVNYY